MGSPLSLLEIASASRQGSDSGLKPGLKPLSLREIAAASRTPSERPREPSRPLGAELASIADPFDGPPSIAKPLGVSQGKGFSLPLYPGGRGTGPSPAMFWKQHPVFGSAGRAMIPPPTPEAPDDLVLPKRMPQARYRPDPREVKPLASALSSIPGSGMFADVGYGTAAIAQSPGQPAGYTRLIQGLGMQGLMASGGAITQALKAAPVKTAVEILASIPAGMVTGEAGRRGAEALGVGPEGQELTRTITEMAPATAAITRAYGRAARVLTPDKPPPSVVPRETGPPAPSEPLALPPAARGEPLALPAPLPPAAPPLYGPGRLTLPGGKPPPPGITPPTTPLHAVTPLYGPGRLTLPGGKPPPPDIKWKQPTPLPLEAPAPLPSAVTPLYGPGRLALPGGEPPPPSFMPVKRAPSAPETLYPLAGRAKEPPPLDIAESVTVTGKPRELLHPLTELPPKAPRTVSGERTVIAETGPATVAGQTAPTVSKKRMWQASAEVARAAGVTKEKIVGDISEQLTGRRSVKGATTDQINAITRELETSAPRPLRPVGDEGATPPKPPEVKPSADTPSGGPPSDVADKKVESDLRQFWRRIYADMYTSIERMGKSGADLRKRLEDTDVTGTVRVRNVFEDLNRPGGDRKRGIGKLTDEEDINIGRVAAGKAEPINDKVADLASIWRAKAHEMADFAKSLNVLMKRGDEWVPFKEIKDFFPHVHPSADEIVRVTVRGRHGPSKPARKRIVKNMAENEGFTEEGAHTYLDEKVKLIRDRSGKYRPETIIRWMMDKGVAKDPNDAMRMLDRFRHSKERRSSSLEYSRTLDMPDYDPSFREAVSRTVKSEWGRLVWIERFGQNFGAETTKKLKAKGYLPKVEPDQLEKLFRQIGAEGGDEMLARGNVQRITENVTYNDIMQSISRFARLSNIPLLGQMAELNIAQGYLGSMIRGGPTAAHYGLVKAFTKSGREAARRCGALCQSQRAMALGEELPTSSHMAYMADMYLFATLGKPSEVWNRWLTANAGKAYSKDLIAMLARVREGTSLRGKIGKILKQDKFAISEMERLGLPTDREPTAEEFYKAMQRFDIDVNFSKSSGYIPEWVHHPAGRMAWQFKTFIYNNTRLIWKEAIRDAFRPSVWKTNPYKSLKSLRNIALLASLYPGYGAAVNWWRSHKKGGRAMDRYEAQSDSEKYFRALTSIGSLGFGGELVEAGERGDVLGALAGPSAGAAKDIIERPIREGPVKGLSRFGLRRYLNPFGVVAPYVEEKLGLSSPSGQAGRRSGR